MPPLQIDHSSSSPFFFFSIPLSCSRQRKQKLFLATAFPEANHFTLLTLTFFTNLLFLFPPPFSLFSSSPLFTSFLPSPPSLSPPLVRSPHFSSPPLPSSHLSSPLPSSRPLSSPFLSPLLSSPLNPPSLSFSLPLIRYYNGSHIWAAIYDENCASNNDMCYEEQVFYKLLSGLHTSTTISIAKNFYPPSKRKNTTEYGPNPGYVVEKFNDHPEYIRNVHFSYVVLLRALRKGGSFLQNFPFFTGNTTDDLRTKALMSRLVDSSILDDCAPVFDAFDERLMFVDDIDNAQLKREFKSAFHNVSNVMDCVQVRLKFHRLY